MEPTELPKSDKRYKVGFIKQDKKGRWRGNPDTVELKRMVIPSSAPIHMQLNPPLVMTKELAKHVAKHLKENL